MKILSALFYLSVFLLVIPAFSFADVVIPPESTLTYQNNLFSYYSNADLTQANAHIEQAFIVVHGSDLNANDYYRTIDLATQKMKIEANAITIAPQFKVPSTPSYPHPYPILPGEFTFTDEGWLRGDPARNNHAVSSFELIDHLVKLLADPAKFPNLKLITITGHSAGGQLTQRYALGSAIETELAKINPQVKMRYIVVNPGSYAYLTGNRPVAGSPGKYAVPSQPHCAYNNYKFGLENLNTYLKQVPIGKMVNDYLNRDVTYLLGEADILTDPADIDEGCEATYQGKTRLERGKNFKAQLDVEFPVNQHHLATVPGIGHTEYGMYLSPVGMNVLFPSQK